VTVRARALGWFLLATTIASAGVLLRGPPLWLLDWIAARYPGCLFRISLQAPIVALTLDDGPDPVTTPLILAELRRHRARATFFLIADRVRGQHDVVSRMVAEGHEIGNHFNYDRASIRLTEDEFDRDVEESSRVLAPYGPVRWARPGSGWYSQAMVGTMTRHGYRCALGSVYSYDATIPWVAYSVWYIRRNVRPGAVLVLHDGGARGERTVRILRAVLPYLHRRGFRVVSLSELAREA
jgi:peptidoglycan/xylan/chitin deacetylase (PgdA/CDA1 family)